MHAKEQGQWCRDMGLSQRALRKANDILTQLRTHVPALQKHAATAATAGKVKVGAGSEAGYGSSWCWVEQAGVRFAADVLPCIHKKW